MFLGTSWYFQNNFFVAYKWTFAFCAKHLKFVSVWLNCKLERFSSGTFAFCKLVALGWLLALLNWFSKSCEIYTFVLDCDGETHVLWKGVSQLSLFDPFHVTGLFLFPLKPSENHRFSNVSRGRSKRPVA